MKRVATGSRMREIDQTAIENRGIAGMTLMERAGQGLTECILREMETLGLTRCLILCGNGNNGGDGYVAARRLKQKGIEAQVFSLRDPRKLRGDAKENFERYEDAGGRVHVLDHAEEEMAFSMACQWAEIIVDAMLGTGIQREVTGTIREVMERIRWARTEGNCRSVIAVDVPSGVGADDGRIYGMAVPADRTVTFQMDKYGLHVEPGRSMAGEVEVVDIGLPDDLCQMDTGIAYIMEERDVACRLPARTPWMNKGDAGKLLIVAGSVGMAGAAALAARAAYRGGAGLVKVAAAPEVIRTVQGWVPEATSLRLGENVAQNVQDIETVMEDYDALVVGPGLGQERKTADMVRELIRRVEKPMVLDADGLNVVAGNLDVLAENPGSLILTPHPGEMGRLTGTTADEVNKKRREVAEAFAAEHSVIVLLKGSGTLIACPWGRMYVNPTGNSAMATAGSGDVLSGIIGALLASGCDEETSAAAGAYIHGRAGDLCRAHWGEHGTMAGDLADYVAYALKDLTTSGETGILIPRV